MRIKTNWAMCCSTLVLGAAATAAAAQTAPAADVAPAQASEGQAQELDEIVVTGSRVVTNGYTAPTPVTVVTAEDLRNTSPSLTDALRQLPQLTGSSSATTPGASPGGGGASTADTPDLRNLGATRTLVLLDGRRPPASGLSGTADTGLFPLLLVKRVDIVTGGASAAYGSDAVAGVVNYILDTKFRGFLAESRAGVSAQGDGNSYNGQFAGGVGFAQDRGSFIFNLSVGQQDLVDGYDRDWAQSYFAAIPNPLAGQAGQPRLLLRNNVNLSAATFGGLIITPGVLRDTAFDANGNPVAYNHGTLNTGALEVGGDGARYPRSIVSDIRSHTGFGHLQFDVNDNLSVFAEGGYGYSESVYPNLLPFNLGGGAFTIQRDNAFLPDSIRQTMTANGLATIQVAKLGGNFGRNVVHNTSETYNGTVGFTATRGEFTLDGYYEHGETQFDIVQTNQRITANALRAVDAVRSGGQIVCRSTLTDPTNGCVPWSPFGTQPLTDAQRAYQQGTGHLVAKSKQDVVALTLRGRLFDNWAGPVSAAVGAEYRSQSGDITVDPISAAIGFANGNPQPSGGSYDVKEAFAELALPLYHGNGFVKSADLNAAVRRTDYSTSGAVTTWKVGLSSQIVGGLLLRGTVSQDIRAPNIGDLFGPRIRSATSVIDPLNGNRVYGNIITFSGSNPALLPEEARTFTAGISYRPPWLLGFGASVDYYSIKIDDAISSLSAQRIVDQCGAGDTSLCGLVVRNGANEITQISSFALNIQKVEIAGTDVDVSYRTELGGGALTVRAIGTYLSDYESSAPGAPVIRLVGTTAYPKIRANLQATYRIGATTLSVQERMIGSHDRVIAPSTIDNNDVPRIFYTNVTLRHEFDLGKTKPEAFITISNLFDKDPPVSDTNSLTVGTAIVADGALYDVMGRYITVGARLRF